MVITEQSISCLSTLDVLLCILTAFLPRSNVYLFSANSFQQGTHRHQTSSRYRNTDSHALPYHLWPKVTSSIKPEVHSISQHRQRRTEPRPQGICTTNFVTIGTGVPEICSRTDRHTDRQTNWSQYSAPLPGLSKKASKGKVVITRRQAAIIFPMPAVTSLPPPAEEHYYPLLVTNYTAWWQKHTGVSSLPNATMRYPARTRTRDLWIASPIPYQWGQCVTPNDLYAMSRSSHIPQCPVDGVNYHS